MSLCNKPSPMAFNGKVEYNLTRQRVAITLRTWRAAIKEFPGRCSIKRRVGAQATTYQFIADVTLYEDDPDPIAVPRAGRSLARKATPIELEFGGKGVRRGRYDTARELRIWRKNQRDTKGKAYIFRQRSPMLTYYEFIDTADCFSYQPNPIQIRRLGVKRAPIHVPDVLPSNEQMMASYQRIKAAQGTAYGYSLNRDNLNDAQVLALLQIKDTLRRVGMAIVADGLGRVQFVRREVGGDTLAVSMYV